MARCDIFCTVVDNLGDIGVCWRLARQLAEEYGFRVRLWVDDLVSLSCLCPGASVDATSQQIGAVEVRRWDAEFPLVDVADVVIEAFACDPPATYIAEMARRDVPPVWINLEYLSAEDWVEGCHLLPSTGSGTRLTKYFFFPGFTPQTGGLIREHGLTDARKAFDAVARAEFLRRLGIQSGKNELLVSLFCYRNLSLPGLLGHWSSSETPIRVLTLAGLPTEQVGQWLGGSLSPGAEVRRGSLTVNALPFIPQEDFDRMLWSCDLNFVRGEDSFVRAQLARQPFVWQIYTQTEQTHLVKLEAFLARFLKGFPQANSVRRFWDAWNKELDVVPAWREFAAVLPEVRSRCEEWANLLDRVPDLANNLARFVERTMGSACSRGSTDASGECR